MTRTVQELPAVRLGLVPEVSDLERAYWTGGAQGQLWISHCGACGNWSHPPFPRCPRCHSADVAPTLASGLGTVYSFTVNEHAWSPALAVPYVVAVVELDEQQSLHIYTNLVGVAPADVALWIRGDRAWVWKSRRWGTDHPNRCGGGVAACVTSARCAR